MCIIIFMRPLILLSLFLCAVRVYSQDSACPKYALALPAGMVRFEEQVNLFVTTPNSDGRPIEGAKVQWKTSAGRIVSGNGTPKIVFDASKAESGSNITVSAQISGPRCSALISDIFPVQAVPIIDLFNTFGKVSNNELRARIDNLFIILNSSGTDYNVVLTTAFEKGSSRAYKVGRIKSILADLKWRKYDASRFFFYFRPDAEVEETGFWYFKSDTDFKTFDADRAKSISAEAMPKLLSTLFR